MVERQVRPELVDPLAVDAFQAVAAVDSLHIQLADHSQAVAAFQAEAEDTGRQPVEEHIEPVVVVGHVAALCHSEEHKNSQPGEL